MTHPAPFRLSTARCACGGRPVAFAPGTEPETVVGRCLACLVAKGEPE